MHPDFGRDVTVIGDFVITPFFSEEGCDALLELSDAFKDKYKKYDYTTDLSLWKVSYYFFEEYAQFMGKEVNDLLKDVFPCLCLVGAYSPFLVKQEVGESTQFHNDLSMITISLKLNTDYEGGEIIFPRQNFSNKNLPRGYALFFPGDVTHPHYVTEVTKGVKHTLAGFTHPATDEPKGDGYSSLLFSRGG